MFLGEALCFVLYLVMKKRDPDSFRLRMLEAKSKGKKIEFNPLLLAIPAFCDFLSSTLQYVALNFISASVYQMLRGKGEFICRWCDHFDGATIETVPQDGDEEESRSRVCFGAGRDCIGGGVQCGV